VYVAVVSPDVAAYSVIVRHPVAPAKVSIRRMLAIEVNHVRVHTTCHQAEHEHVGRHMIHYDSKDAALRYDRRAGGERERKIRQRRSRLKCMLWACRRSLKLCAAQAPNSRGAEDVRGPRQSPECLPSATDEGRRKQGTRDGGRRCAH
jgi:hypothetical protein